MCGTCAHVGGDQDSFLGLAVMQVCGDQVLPRARNGAYVWRLGYYVTCSRNIFVGPAYSWGSQQLGLLVLCSSEVTHGLLQLTGSGANWWRRSQRAG